MKTVVVIIAKHAKNIAITGIVLLAQTLISARLRSESSKSVDEIVKDVRRTINHVREKRSQAI